MLGKRRLLIIATLSLSGAATMAQGSGPAFAASRTTPAMPTVAATASTAPSVSNIKNEHLSFVQGKRSVAISGPGLTERAMIGRTTTGRAALAAGSSSSLGFLTRPYSTWHNITSVFDHCNPDYSTDGRVCEFDGSVGLRSNGIDPTFSLGYAQTRGGGDYISYDGHNGWDYALAYENVLSAGDGVVQIAGTDSVNPCFGQTVTIQHPQGYTTRYGHLAAIYVSPGQTVARGQVIGQSGNTGCSSGAHLHFGVYVTSSWTAVDPWGWWGAAGADPWPSDPGDLWLTGTAQFPVPGAPTNVSAIAGNNSATISWTAPAFDGGTGNTNYLIVASPGGAQVSAFGSQSSIVLGGLTNGTAYSFTVTAVNSVGAAASASSNTVIPTGWVGRYRAVTPTRVLDTRSGLGGNITLGAGSTIDLSLAGHAGLPASGVAAVALNVTATNATSATYISVYPSGLTRPAVSNLNLSPGATVANLVDVGVGTGGNVSLYNNAGTVDLIADVVGWYASDTTSAQGVFVPLSASRLLDTRIGLGATRAPIATGQTIDLAIAGHGGVPTSGAAAVVLNLTVTGPSRVGFVSAYPSGIGRPATSSINYAAGQIVANRVIVPLGANGMVSLYNCCGTVDAVVDVNGWFSDGTDTSLTGGTFYGLSPTPLRAIDTRTGQGGVQGPVGAGVTSFPVAGLSGMPAAPRAVVANVTITDVSAAGYRTVFPDGAALPSSSDLNVLPGHTTANLVILAPGADGKIAVYSPGGTSSVLIDILGYYN